MKLAIEGDLIAKYGKDAEGEKQVVVVASFPEKNVADAILQRVKDVLDEYRVRTILPKEVHNFAQQVLGSVDIRSGNLRNLRKEASSAARFRRFLDR